MRRQRALGEFEQFVARSVDGLLRTAYLVVWDLPAAEDLVQECLYKVARQWPRVRTMEYPQAYARRILVNLALDGAPQRARRHDELQAGAVTDMIVPDEWAERAFGLVEDRSEVVSALGALAPRQRAVLTLRYLEDLPEAEVAEIMGCSVGTVKSTASRALDRLRALLVVTSEASPGSSGSGDAATAALDDAAFFVHHLTINSTHKGGIDQ